MNEEEKKEQPNTDQPEPQPQAQPVRGIEEGEEAVKTVQLLVFSLDKEEYATIITDVREITEITQITTIPNAPTFISGIINLRGKVVVVVNLEERFRLDREHKDIEAKHIIIFEIGEATFGVIVDEVTEVLRIPEGNIKPAPDIISTKIKADYLSGVGLIEERLLLLLDFKKVLSEQELAELSQLAEFHQKTVVKPVKEEKADVGKKIEEKVKELAEKKETEEVPKKSEITGKGGVKVDDKPTATDTSVGGADKPAAPTEPEKPAEEKPAEEPTAPAEPAPSSTEEAAATEKKDEEVK